MEPAQGDPLGFTPPSARGRGRARWKPTLGSGFLDPPNQNPLLPFTVALSLPAHSCCAPENLTLEPWRVDGMNRGLPALGLAFMRQRKSEVRAAC